MSSNQRSGLAVFFVFVLTVGLSAAGLSAIRLARRAGETATTRGSLATPGRSARDLLDGGVTAQFESELESRFSLRDAAITVTALLRYVLFRDGAPGVVVGRDSWLFTQEEFERYETDNVRLDERVDFIRNVRSELRDHGVDLVVLIVPSKARIMGARLTERQSRLAIHERFPGVVTQLQGAGVTVVDPGPALRATPDPFLRTDTHWSPAGAAVAAREVAKSVEILGLAAGSPRSEYRTVVRDTTEITGDLLSFVPLGIFARAFNLHGETVEGVETIQVSEPELGLFDVPKIPVTLVGTSFSADSRWNFAGQLKEALALDVLDVSSEAVGPFVPMAEYLSGSAFDEVKPQLVVWEIPERYLTLPAIEVPGMPAETR